MTKFGIIVEDNPISRCYLNIFLKKNIKFDSIIYLSKKNFFLKKLTLYRNFYLNNFYAINFLKDKNLLDVISYIEEFFSYRQGFCKDMYKFSNLLKISNKIIFTGNNLINSKETINILKNEKSKIYLNTGSQILRDVLDTNHKFLHIHPGYLPLVKGADGTLWHIKNFNNLGVSAFFMSSKIDEGEILLRDKFILPKLKIKNFSKYDTQSLYRFWFSFFDPLLRGTLLTKLIDMEFDVKKIPILDDEVNSGFYFSFMQEKDKKQIFKKIFFDGKYREISKS